MSYETVISHLLEEPDIHRVYIERLRAEYLAQTLWQLVNNRVSWERHPATVPLVETSSRGGDGRASGGFKSESLRYLNYAVPPVAVLDFRYEGRRIYSSSYREGLNTLTIDEKNVWDEHMLRNRYSAVFAIVHRHAMVRRSDSVRSSRELASAALKIAVFSELRTGERT